MVSISGLLRTGVRPTDLLEWSAQVEDEFDIRGERRAGSSVVSVFGEVDVATATRFREFLEATIENDFESVVVDLTGVTFIDSTGLGVLIGARKRCDAKGRPLRIVVSEPRILKVFEITGLTEVFEIQPTLELAVRD